MLYFRELPVLATRAGIWANIVRLEFGPILPAVIAAAGIALGIRKWRLAVLLVGVTAVNVLAALTYRAPQTVEYLIPSYVAMALILGLGVGEIKMARPWRQIAAAWLIVAAAQVGLGNYGSFQLMHQDTSARDYAERILADAPPDTLILANWHRATPFWYLQQVEGLRPDVQVQYVYPEGSLPNEQVWLRRVSASIGERPVIVTNWFYAFEGADWGWTPLHGAWLARREPLEEAPEAMVRSGAIFGEEIELLGYALDTPALAPGSAVSLRVYWRPLRALAQDYSSFAQLLGPSGVVGQGDLAHTAREIAAGQVCVDSYQFPLLLQTAPGPYPLITGFYYAQGGGWQRLTTGGQDHLALATVEVRAPERPPVTGYPLVARLVGGPRLVGVDWDRTVPGQTRAYLHWWQPRSAGREERMETPRNMRVQIKGGGQVLAEAALPGLAPGSGATVTADLGTEAGRPSLAVVGEDGRLRPWVGPWGAPLREMALPAAPEGAHYVPLGGEMSFVGMDKAPEKVSRGEAALLSPRFLSLRPLAADYAVSVGLAGAEGGWESKSDGIPALGAIPTLKWLGGWTVRDPHAVSAPAEAAQGEAAITLSVYDAFTLRPLNVLDDRLAQQGQGTYLRLHTVRIE